MATLEVAFAGFHGLPVVEPVSGAQIQFWASFAAQATTRNAFGIVTDAFNAFWMETSSYEQFQQMCGNLDKCRLAAAITCLDNVVATLGWAVERWQDVLKAFNRDRDLQASAVSWYLNAADRVQVLSLLLSQVVEMIVSYCGQMQWEMPLNTCEYLARHQ